MQRAVRAPFRSNAIFVRLCVYFIALRDSDSKYTRVFYLVYLVTVLLRIGFVVLALTSTLFKWLSDSESIEDPFPDIVSS